MPKEKKTWHDLFNMHLMRKIIIFCILFVFCVFVALVGLKAQAIHPMLHAYDVKHYGIYLEASDTSTFIKGSTSVYVEVVAPKMDTFLIELSDILSVDSVYQKEVKQNYVHKNDHVIVPLENALLQGEKSTFVVYYQGTVGGKGFFSGITNAKAYYYDKHVTWTMSEPFSAKKWFACKQVINDKADSVSIFLTVPGHCMAGSNGLLTNVVDLPDGKKRYEWKSYYPIAYYLPFFAVSDYLEYNIYAHPVGVDDSLLIQNFIYNDTNYLARNKKKIDKTIELIELFSELFGPYPFAKEKYGHCLAPMGGGMENQTMTTLQGFYFLLVAHELGHMWFGNNVTCAAWQDIWINEGFASYTEYLALENLEGMEEAISWMDAAYTKVKEEKGGSVFVPESQKYTTERIFDVRLSYKKGAALVHMIRFELQDDDVFFKVLKDFQVQFADSVATAMDFKHLLEKTSGKDFSDFFDQWFYGEGYPVYSVQWSHENDILTMDISQETSADNPSLFKMLMHYRVYFEDGDTNLLIRQDKNQQQIKMYINKPVISVAVNPDKLTLEESKIAEKLNHKSYFSVDPNPFSGVINIAFIDNNVMREVIITDITGKVVKKIETKDANYTLYSDDLHEGLYIITVDNGKNQYSKKVLKLKDK